MAQAKAAGYDELATQLGNCQTVTELFKLAASDAFRQASATLNGEALDALRGVYKQRQTVLDGRVRLGEFDGQTVRLVGVNWWHSDKWDQGATEGEGVTLVFRPESDLGKRYKALTSSAVIVRFCNTLSDVPSEESPLRVQLRQVPVNDAERAAKGQRMWTIKRLPIKRLPMGEQRAATPF